MVRKSDWICNLASGSTARHSSIASSRFSSTQVSLGESGLAWGLLSGHITGECSKLVGVHSCYLNLPAKCLSESRGNLIFFGVHSRQRDVLAERLPQKFLVK